MSNGGWRRVCGSERIVNDEERIVEAEIPEGISLKFILREREKNKHEEERTE